MSDFNKSLQFMLKNEGGFVNNPNDRGGATIFGITLSTYSRYLGRPASVEEVREMSQEVAGKIYRAHYWNVIALDEVVSDGVACALFDQAVLRGPINLAKVIQRICGVEPDGHVGTLTLNAINEAKSEELVDRIADNAAAVFRGIVKRNPSQKVFLKGWLARAERLRALKAWG